MIVYCDTSFLVSFLNEADINHRAARELAAKHRTAEFVFLTFDQRQQKIADLLGLA